MSIGARSVRYNIVSLTPSVINRFALDGLWLPGVRAQSLLFIRVLGGQFVINGLERASCCWRVKTQVVSGVARMLFMRNTEVISV